MIDAKLLIQKYREGKCTEEELRLLHSWFHELNKDDDTLLNEDDLTNNINSVSIPLTESTIKKLTWPRIVASVAAVIIIGFLILHLGLFNENNSQLPKPISNSVILELENGKIINLNNVKNGQIQNIEGITISKTRDGIIQYRFNNLEDDLGKNNLAYHTITTPKGELFKILLSDETSVILNAESSIRFPTSFHNLKTREVELSGEAYFDVSKIIINNGISQPFIVKSKNQKVEVLGTVFNIQAYRDEPLSKTTLAHGKVSINLNNTSDRILLSNPGEQGLVHENNIKKTIIDPQKEIAWIHNKIVFEDQDIYSIMRTISRYYPIEIEYVDDFKNLKFGGVISKGKTLKEILELIEETGEIKFEILPATNSKSERRIKIMK